MELLPSAYSGHVYSPFCGVVKINPKSLNITLNVVAQVTSCGPNKKKKKKKTLCHVLVAECHDTSAVYGGA